MLLGMNRRAELRIKINFLVILIVERGVKRALVIKIEHDFVETGYFHSVAERKLNLAHRSSRRKIGSQIVITRHRFDERRLAVEFNRLQFDRPGQPDRQIVNRHSAPDAAAKADAAIGLPAGCKMMLFGQEQFVGSLIERQAVPVAEQAIDVCVANWLSERN